MERTREEHIKWCIERAIAEMDFDGQTPQALISMASDLRKHPETNSRVLIDLCMMQLLINPNPSRQQVIDFLKGFH